MSLYVGNLPKNIKIEEVKEKFRRAGPCEVDLKDGYAIIDYKEYTDAVRALVDYNNTGLGGERMEIEWAEDRAKEEARTRARREG